MPPRRRRRCSDRAPQSSPSRIRIRVPERVAAMVAVSDCVAIAIAMFPCDYLPDVAVSSCVVASCVWFSRRRASLSRRAAITAGYFRRCTRFLGGMGRVRKVPARPTARPTDKYLTDRRSTRASLSNGEQPSPRRGLLWPCVTITSATADHAHLRALVVHYTCRRAAGPVIARGCRARTDAHATLSSCR